VQPFKLSDNLLSLTRFSAGRLANEATSKLGSWIGMGKVDTGARAAVSDSTKLAAKQLNWLPMDAELKYGQREHDKETEILERDSRLGRKFYPVADAMLAELTAKIAEPSEYNFKIFILKHSTRNAMARPGGFLYLDQGLLDDEAQRRKAYFALAHEIAHVLQRHETRELQSMVVDSFTAEDELVEAWPQFSGNPVLLLDRVKLGKDTYTQHNIDQELQADSCAARLLGRLYEPAELGATIEGFLKDLPPYEDAPPPTPPKTDAEKVAAVAHDIVSTPMARHPNSKERADNLDQMYRAVSAPTQ
jgi:predicted Zn-dependent protease